jgi:hypothetical protein
LKCPPRNKMRDDHIFFSIFFSLILTYQGMLYLILKFEEIVYCRNELGPLSLTEEIFHNFAE